VVDAEFARRKNVAEKYYFRVSEVGSSRSLWNGEAPSRSTGFQTNLSVLDLTAAFAEILQLSDYSLH